VTLILGASKNSKRFSPWEGDNKYDMHTSVRSATIVWNGDDVQDEKKRSAFSLENAKP
jgi:hypothetical protein